MGVNLKKKKFLKRNARCIHVLTFFCWPDASPIYRPMYPIVPNNIIILYMMSAT